MLYVYHHLVKAVRSDVSSLILANVFGSPQPFDFRNVSVTLRNIEPVICRVSKRDILPLRLLRYTNFLSFMKVPAPQSL